MSLPNVTAGCITFPQVPLTFVVARPDVVFKTTPEGLCAQTQSFFGNMQDLIGASNLTIVGTSLTVNRGFQSPNPIFTNLGVYTSTVKNMKGGMGSLQIEYRGLDPSFTVPPGAIYSLDRSTSNEPIQTHPKWSMASAGAIPGPIAGLPNAPVNGAIFRTPLAGGGYAYNPNITGNADPGFSPNTAVFYGWASGSNVTSGTGNSNAPTGSFVGTEDFLLAGQVWTATYVSLSAPTSTDTDGVGFIGTPLGSPPTPSGYIWIYLGIRYTNQAGVFRIDKSWRLFQNNTASQIIYTP